MKQLPKILSLCLILSAARANAADLYLNLFRNPSIGPELKWTDLSIHTGFYTTILSKDEKGKYVSTEFVRTGLTLWPTQYLYVSASHLYGVTRDWQNKHGGIYEAGLQALVWSDRVALRFGIAVLPSKEFGTKVNPTPGLSVRLSL